MEHFLGFQLYMSEPQPNQLVVNLQDPVIQFCQKLEFGRIQKASTDVRILHFKKEQLPPELV